MSQVPSASFCAAKLSAYYLDFLGFFLSLMVLALTTFPRAPCITGEISVGSGVLFEPILRCSFFGKDISYCYHGLYLARVLS